LRGEIEFLITGHWFAKTTIGPQPVQSTRERKERTSSLGPKDRKRDKYLSFLSLTLLLKPLPKTLHTNIACFEEVAYSLFCKAEDLETPSSFRPSTLEALTGSLKH